MIDDQGAAAATERIARKTNNILATDPSPRNIKPVNQSKVLVASKTTAIMAK